MDNSNKTILIGEDKVLIAEHLKDIVTSLGYKVVGIYHDKIDVLSGIKQHKPDIALLDIKMENKYTGVEIGEFIVKNYNFPFIYVTAHSDVQTLQKALKTKPNGYILKPFKEIEIKIAIELAFERANSDFTKFMIIKDGTQEMKIYCNEIMYLKSDDNYVEIFTKEQKYIKRATLKEICANLNKNIFVRTHRSFIINKKYATKFHVKNVFINEIKIPVSKKYIETVRAIFSSPTNNN